MGSYTLELGAAFAIATGALYFFIGHRLRHRRLYEKKTKLANQLFVIWWFALTATSLIGALTSILGALGVESLSVYISLTYVNLFAVCAALWGLLYYLAYLFLGNPKALFPITILYVAFYISIVYLLIDSRPVSVSIGRWSTNLEYETPISGIYPLMLLLFLVMPQILSGIAYFSLYFKAQEATQKYRIALVSWSIIVWFSSAIVGSLLGVTGEDWWQIASKTIGLTAALTILIAYEPLDWIKKQFGVRSITDDAALFDAAAESTYETSTNETEANRPITEG